MLARMSEGDIEVFFVMNAVVVNVWQLFISRKKN